MSAQYYKKKLTSTCLKNTLLYSFKKISYVIGSRKEYERNKDKSETN